jgi:hypothetical protein
VDAAEADFPELDRVARHAIERTGNADNTEYYRNETAATQVSIES